ncbi:hypothetical protein PYW07_004994 [Mythimna separata]|uniref:Tudor domain-containing protein n=1 Tax=Mythimna separata TaxID=271217 RepID=A0AAD7YEG3_MYTSE|nr:hypothetical protein PYW07_004994 [Mythimna separata]
MQSKLLVPIVLGISLVTVSAFVVYYVFKKDEEEEETNKKVKTSRINVIEVNVPKSIVPALIGRGGSNIKEIEKTTGAKVNMREFSGKDHDVCVIRGRSEATQIAETLVHDFINQQPVNVEDSMNVPAWACGRIIGKWLKDHDVCVIRGRSEATQIAETLVHDFINQQPVNVEDSMNVPAWACGRIIGKWLKDHDVCVIRGRSEATQIAETLVHDFINQQPVNVEDSMNVPAWACGRIIGKWLKDHDVCVIRGRSEATQIAETLVHDFINQQPVNVEDSMNVPAWACGRIIGKWLKDHDVCVIRGRSEATQIAETLVHDFINQQPVNVEDSMNVPAWACGRIIGSQGENINSISHRSGAKIKISAINDKATERKVMFLGTKEQIKVAKDLIDNCVAQEKCRREIEQSKRSPRHVQSSSKSPSPTPSASTSDNAEDPSGDSPVHRHAQYKRPENRGAPIEVYVSAVSSPSRFWVQFVGPQVTQLDSLVEEMTEYYGKKENREAHALAHVSVGQVVAAVFRHDGRWYRARVHDIRPNEFDATQQVADVFFLDYGDSEYVATHELCELRADLLRLRFQAMECFLAGVRPAASDEPRERWPQLAVERFEELTQVARWKPLLSKTCTYKKTATAEGEKEKEIPGIKLFDNTDEGELDIGAVLIAEGWAEAGPGERPAPVTHKPPFGDLGNSRVLGMLAGERSSSVPKDHKDDRAEQKQMTTDDSENDNDRMTTSKSLGFLEAGEKPLSISNFDLSYPDNSLSKAVNGSHENFLHMEKQNLDKEGNIETGSLDNITTPVPSTPLNLAKSPLDEFKANMNRIDSHHNLEFLERSQHEK